MMDVLLLVQLVPRKDDLRGVHDDHVISGIAVGRVNGLMLTSEDSRYLRCETSENHPLRIHNVPAALYGFALGHIGIHGDSSILLYRFS